MQEIIALSIVCLAAAYLTWRGWRFVSARRAGCGSACSGCSTQQGKSGEPLVTIAPLRKSERS